MHLACEGICSILCWLKRASHGKVRIVLKPPSTTNGMIERLNQDKGQKWSSIASSQNPTKSDKLALLWLNAKKHMYADRVSCLWFNCTLCTKLNYFSYKHVNLLVWLRTAGFRWRTRFHQLNARTHWAIQYRLASLSNIVPQRTSDKGMQTWIWDDDCWQSDPLIFLQVEAAISSLDIKLQIISVVHYTLVLNKE